MSIFQEWAGIWNGPLEFREKSSGSSNGGVPNTRIDEQNSEFMSSIGESPIIGLMVEEDLEQPSSVNNIAESEVSFGSGFELNGDEFSFDSTWMDDLLMTTETLSFDV